MARAAGEGGFPGRGLLRLVRSATVHGRRRHDLGHARVALVAGLLALVVPSPAGATLTDVPSAHTLLTLDPDGVVEVLEQIEVRADEPTAATWQITMQRGELFADPSLFVNDRRYRPGDGKRPGT